MIKERLTPHFRRRNYIVLFSRRARTGRLLSPIGRVGSSPGRRRCAAATLIDGNSDANSGYGDDHGRGGFDGGSGPGPDLRSGLSRLPAGLRQRRRLHLLPLHLDGAVCPDGVGPPGPVHRQSLFCRRTNAAGISLSAASPNLLEFSIRNFPPSEGARALPSAAGGYFPAMK